MSPRIALRASEGKLREIRGQILKPFPAFRFAPCGLLAAIVFELPLAADHYIAIDQALGAAGRCEIGKGRLFILGLSAQVVLGGNAAER